MVNQWDPLPAAGPELSRPRPPTPAVDSPTLGSDACGRPAFGVLTRVSQELNRKLVDIAGELTDTGAVPGSQRRQE